MLFHVTLESAEDGWIVAECPALPGGVSQGQDEQEALTNIREAITAWLWAEDQKAVKQLQQQSFMGQPREYVYGQTTYSRRSGNYDGQAGDCRHPDYRRID